MRFLWFCLREITNGYFMKKLRNFLQTKEAGISAERPALNLSKIFYRIGYNENATAASF